MADSDDKRIISANWAKDEDINRCLYLLLTTRCCNMHYDGTTVTTKFCSEFLLKIPPLPAKLAQLEGL